MSTVHGVERVKLGGGGGGVIMLYCNRPFFCGKFRGLLFNTSMTINKKTIHIG